MIDFDVEAIRTEVRAMDYVRGTPGDVAEWRIAYDDSRHNHVIENMIPTPNEDAFWEMMLEEAVSPPLASQILLRLLNHPDADPALAITPLPTLANVQRASEMDDVTLKTSDRNEQVASFDTGPLLRTVDDLDVMRDHLKGDNYNAPKMRNDLLRLHDFAMRFVNEPRIDPVMAEEMFDLAADLECRIEDLSDALARMLAPIRALQALEPSDQVRPGNDAPVITLPLGK